MTVPPRRTRGPGGEGWVRAGRVGYDVRVNQGLGTLAGLLDTRVVQFGASAITIRTVLYLAVFLTALTLISGFARRWLVSALAARTAMRVGEREAIGTIFRYGVIVAGVLIAVQTAGLDLTTLNVVAATVGIGIGFGLQSAANNLISGVIILFERPIQIGDRIEVDGVHGDVVHIGGRSTIVVTNDNISIIVPNSKFITEKVLNWSHSDPKVRFRIPVTVAYGADVRVVARVLLEVAAGSPDVLTTPEPSVRLTEFGDNGIALELLVWSSSLVHRKGLLTSGLNFAIAEAFGRHGIEFPYPQRDVHIRSVAGPGVDVAGSLRPSESAPTHEQK